ncbi:MAG: hypothetical protein IJF46_07250 [Bacteroidaceae bacterium]|nr:hypothetical protein [Bacteroidaceae bacterium]
MKRVLTTLALFLSLLTANAQEYLEIVSFESESDGKGTFTSVGFGEKKSDAETNAIKSLFHTLLFTGVTGVNDDAPLVTESKPGYTNSFFNSQARYTGYLIECEAAGDASKVGGKYQRNYKITIRLKQLINDVKRNTGGNKKPATIPQSTRLAPTLQASPKIIVVPFAQDEESYQAILNSNFDLRAAVNEVEKGFQELNIETENILSAPKSSQRRAEFETDAASSNDKELLRSTDADVYVVVDIKKNTSAEGTSIALILKAYETATDNNWGSQNSWTKPNKNADISYLCALAVKAYLPDFLKQIEKNFMQPASVVIEFSVLNETGITMRDRLKNGKRLSAFISEWLEENAYNGEYHLQGVVDESAIFDDVLMPRVDKKGKKMNTNKFAEALSDALYEAGVDTEIKTAGNNIMITITSTDL